MTVSTTTIAAKVPIPVLVVEASPPAEAASGPKPVLLFLHGKGEASPYPSELPKVLFHLTPPFRALTNELRGVTVVAPQAPRLPDDDWNWREYVDEMGTFLKATYPGRPILATGFSRGGLGVLQLVGAHPGMIERWAIVDPQSAASAEEQDAITPAKADANNGWLRFGDQIKKNTPFSRHIASALPPDSSRFVDLGHVELALKAFGGSALEGDQDLYAFLGLSFVPSNAG